MVTDYFPTIEAAWASWNTRPGEDALQAKLAAALEVCRVLVAWPDVYGKRDADQVQFRQEFFSLLDKARKVVEG